MPQGGPALFIKIGAYYVYTLESVHTYSVYTYSVYAYFSMPRIYLFAGGLVPKGGRALAHKQAPVAECERGRAHHALPGGVSGWRFTVTCS